MKFIRRINLYIRTNKCGTRCKLHANKCERINKDWI